MHFESQYSMNPELVRRLKQLNNEAQAILLDISGTILTWSERASQLLGYRSEEIIGQNISLFYMPLQREAALHQKLLDEARENGSATHSGNKVRKDGSCFTGTFTISAIYDDNKVIGFAEVLAECQS